MPIHVLPVRRLGQNGGMTGQARSRKLMAMAERCQRGPASRELDGAVCCVLHDVEDGNSLSNALLRISRQNGEVLIEKPGAWPLGWFAAPAFTSDTEAARALYPSSPASLPADPLEACAAGLRARAAAAALGNELPAPLIPRYRH